MAVPQWRDATFLPLASEKLVQRRFDVIRIRSDEFVGAEGRGARCGLCLSVPTDGPFVVALRHREERNSTILLFQPRLLGHYAIFGNIILKS